MRILLDTNILISALLFGGKPRRILQSIINKQYVAVTSPILLSELADVLRKKFDYSKQAVEAVDMQIRKQFDLVVPRKTINILADIPDNRVLEAAVEGECEVIITGDAELLALKSYRTIHIITPDTFSRMMEN